MIDLKFLACIVLMLFFQFIMFKFIKENSIIIIKHVTECFKALDETHQKYYLMIMKEILNVNVLRSEDEKTEEQWIVVKKGLSSEDEKEDSQNQSEKKTRSFTEEQKKAASEKRRQWWAEKKAREAMQQPDQIPPTV